MKYIVILAASAVLLPTLVSGQSLPVKDCRTLEAAGYFLGPDEVMADGLVCKIVKAKAAGPIAAQASRKESDSRAKLALLGIIDTKSQEPDAKPDSAAGGAAASAATQTSRKDSDPRRKLALLGIIDTKSQEPDAKADSESAATAPEASAKAAPGGAAASESSAAPQNATFEVDHGLSLGDVARAYQKSSRPQTAKKPENQVAAEAPATATPVVKSEARSATAAPASPVVPVQKTDIPVRTSAVAPAALMDSKTDATPAASTLAASAAAAAQPAAKTGAIEAQPGAEVKLESAPRANASTTPAVTEAQPAAKTRAREAEPSPKAEPNLSPEAIAPATTATEVSQQEMKTGSFGAREGARSEERPEVRAAMPELESESTSERPQEVKLSVFKAPKESNAEMKPQVPVDPFGAPPEDAAIQEPRPGCAKIVSLGSMERDRLVLATPDWAMRWLEKNQKRFPGVCFADSPLSGVPNYLIVFFTAAPPASQADLGAKAIVPASISSTSSAGTFTTSFGSTWHYTYDNAATTTVTTAWTESVRQNQPGQTLYASAYSEQGIPISRHWPGEVKGHEKETSSGHRRKHDAVSPAVRMMSDLLGEMMADIAAH